MTGLIGALFDIYFPIINLRPSNQEQQILTGEKPAFLFPFGRRIGSLMTWSSGNMKKGLLEKV